ncbi:uncharacterized protein K441DRAFT_564791 [Cenococcum geophilum 1.58]|uniref:uncharacterized protein n=1 Tax=Cenococcum geophilum 1.58 TaxID=794803 RepID=UPI00358E10AC|nr:hypothetical protein K441DRAFT_564791 [Cenococcum geophilum 1.58]
MASPDLQPGAGPSETSREFPLLSPKQERLFTKRHIHRWKSPLLMSSFFVIGLAMSLAHCIFYPALKKKIVGDSSSQEEKLRFGTAFSFLAQISLGASVWTVYTQWLWRTVRRKDITVGVFNSAFSADTSFWSLLNFEMLRKLRTGSAMALFAWHVYEPSSSLLLPPFFTPATLFVYPSTNTQEINEPMPYPAIADSSVGHRFAYSPPFRRGTTQYVDDVSRLLTGPRTTLNLISTATASLGEILPINSPYNSSEYSITFFAPIIKCQGANATETALISGFLEEEMATKLGTSEETDSAYFNFMPSYDSNGTLFAASTPRQQTPSNATNQLWMTFLRSTSTLDANGTRVKERHYQVCRLHNATYYLHVARAHGFQNISGSYDVLEEVPFPNDKPGDVSNMAQHAYSAFMWVIADQLVGKFSWYENTNQSDPSRAAQFGVIDSQIERTSLLGSWDLDAFFDFDEEKGMYKDRNLSLSDQRLQDKALARNRTLDVLIEELSFNTTVGLMHNDLLNNHTNTTVLRTDDVNRYDYKPYGLFIPYALANLFTLISVIFGIYSYIHDDVMPDKMFQDIVSAAEDPMIVHLVRDRKRNLTAVFENGNLKLMAGPERAQKETLRKVKVLWGKVGGRKTKGKVMKSRGLR